MEFLTKLVVIGHNSSDYSTIKHLKKWYDVDTNMFLEKIELSDKLEVGRAYDFYYLINNILSNYRYGVVRKEMNNIYYIIQLDTSFNPISFPEYQVRSTRAFDKCSVRSELDLDIKSWKEYDWSNCLCNDVNIGFNTDNRPNMRPKIEEYIKELEKEIIRCTDSIEGADSDNCTHLEELVIKMRIQTLTEVQNDLQSRLHELVD